MAHTHSKVIIIGGGIAGLCAAVYAQRCGYQADVYEMHDTPGGLATSWRRGGYTFETCLHWLLGSSPDSTMHAQWAEVFDIDKLTFLNPEEYLRFENERGDCLKIYSNIDLLEAEMLQRAPDDAKEIHAFTSAIRRLSNFRLPDPAAGLAGNWRTYLHDLPYLPLLHQLSHIRSSEYGKRFTNQLLRGFFGEGETAQLSAIALFFSLAWMSRHNAGYPIGGSQAIIRLIAERLTSLGGHLHLGAKVERILVEHDTAVGIELANGEKIAADWVISAADGYATHHTLLHGRYTDAAAELAFHRLETFPSYLQVSLGVALDLSQHPGFFTRLLDVPLQVDPATELRQVSFRIFHFDPTFAPAGKTAVTCFLPTRNFQYWTSLREKDTIAYAAAKHGVAEQVLAILERKIPYVRSAIEVVDVSTPATVIRYTGNWKGSMEGWMLTPATSFRQFRNTLPGIDRFRMAGQWIMPGGGLPSGLLTARSAIQTICLQDHVPFNRPQQPFRGVPPTAAARPTSAAAH